MAAAGASCVNEKSAGARAVEAFQIEDVFLVASECWVTRDLNPYAPITEFAYGFKSDVAPEVLVQERADVNGENRVSVLRYYVRAEVRLLKPGIQLTSKPEDYTDENTLAALKFTVATDYRGPKELVQEQPVVGAFSRNAHFHAWPYIREEVHAACGRLRVPRVTLPMLKPNQLGATTDIQAVQKSERV
jgi:hypothetical protein